MENAGFHPYDWAVLIVYLAGIFLVGSWFSRWQTSTKEFFIAGKRMHWLPVALSVVVSVMSGISFIGQPARAYRYDSALIIGLIATVYTGLGGMSAAIWTDVVQFLVLVVGQVLMVCYIASRLDGGFSEIWQVGYADHKAWFSMRFDFSQLTFWTMMMAGPFLLLSDIGADQLTVQRLMTTPDEKAARKSPIFNALFKFPSMTITLGMGVALWVFYQRFPELLTLKSEEYDKIDCSLLRGDAASAGDFGSGDCRPLCGSHVQLRLGTELYRHRVYRGLV